MILKILCLRLCWAPTRFPELVCLYIYTKRNRQRNIIWFNPPFSRAVSTNVGKRFLQLLRHHFPPSNKLHKIFNKNTVKVRYCCTQNVASIIKSHNKKLINTSIKNTLPCNCRKKHECPLDGKCRAENIVYKCVASVHGYPNKVYLGTAEGDFKQRFCNHRMSLTMRATPQTQHFPNMFRK